MAEKKQIIKKKRNTKKDFYEVNAPLTSSKISLYGHDVDELDGKIIKLDLTRSLKGKSFELKLRTVAKDGKLEGEPIGLRLVTSYVRKSIRKGTDYSEDSFGAECKDAFVVVKPLMVTRRRVSRAILKSLRETARKHLLAHLKQRSSGEIFSEITANKLQKSLILKLKKIYPLAFCEIRSFEVKKKKEHSGEEEKNE